MFGADYLAVVFDMFSRQVVRWYISSFIEISLFPDASLMALWRLQPQAPVVVHFEQGCQHGLTPLSAWQGLYQLLQNCSGHEKGIAFGIYAITRDATSREPRALRCPA